MNILGESRIMDVIKNCDTLDYIKTLKDNSIDLIIADPPYFQIKGEFDFGVFKDKDEYLA